MAWKALGLAKEVAQPRDQGGKQHRPKKEEEDAPGK